LYVGKQAVDAESKYKMRQ